MHRRIWGLIAASLALAFQGPCHAVEPKAGDLSGKKIFDQHCLSCHTGGGNNIRPAKPVAGSQHLKSIVLFKAYLSSPPGHMPFYQNVVNNKQVLDAL